MPDHPTPIDDAALDAMIANAVEGVAHEHRDAELHERIRTAYDLLERATAKAQEAETALRIERARTARAGDAAGSRSVRVAEFAAASARKAIRRSAVQLARIARHHPEIAAGSASAPPDCVAILRRFQPASHTGAGR